MAHIVSLKPIPSKGYEFVFGFMFKVTKKKESKIFQI